MDLFSRSSSISYGAAPTDPKLWERHILNQQSAAYRRRSRSVRRFTVDGIPSYDDFQNGWEERHSKKVSVDYTAPILEEEARSSSPEPCVFDISDLNDDLPSSKKSSQASSSGGQRSKHQHGSFRGSPFAPPRFSPYNSPKRTRRFPSADRHPHHSSTESLQDTARRDKARFFAQQQGQHHNRRGRARPSAMPKREQFNETPQPRPLNNSMPDLLSITDQYYQWHAECDDKFQDKTIMTNVPPPPAPACDKCQQDAIIGRCDIPMTCIHTLEILFRGVKSAPGSATSGNGDTGNYFRILKEERNRWHTDRFGMCNPEYKAGIEQAAQLLFVHINELFGKEKSRLESLRAAKEAAKNVTQSPNIYFDDLERKVW